MAWAGQGRQGVRQWAGGVAWRACLGLARFPPGRQAVTWTLCLCLYTHHPHASRQNRQQQQGRGTVSSPLSLLSLPLCLPCLSLSFCLSFSLCAVICMPFISPASMHDHTEPPSGQFGQVGQSPSPMVWHVAFLPFPSPSSLLSRLACLPTALCLLL